MKCRYFYDTTIIQKEIKRNSVGCHKMFFRSSTVHTYLSEEELYNFELLVQDSLKEQ